jgi:hypothetical protein
MEVNHNFSQFLYYGVLYRKIDQQLSCCQVELGFSFIPHDTMNRVDFLDFCTVEEFHWVFTTYYPTLGVLGACNITCDYIC